jgi:hypothetical protein
MSDTDSASEKEEMEKMTKEEIWFLLKRSGCTMLAGRNPKLYTKEQMIEHLTKSNCPVLMRIVNPIKTAHKK